MDDVKPVIPTSTFDEIAAPIFAPHGFWLHTHAPLRNAILKLVKSYQDILYESEGLTVISGREGTYRKKLQCFRLTLHMQANQAQFTF